MRSLASLGMTKPGELRVEWRHPHFHRGLLISNSHAHRRPIRSLRLQPGRGRGLGHQRFSGRRGCASRERVFVYRHRPLQRHGCGRRSRLDDPCPIPGRCQPDLVADRRIGLGGIALAFFYLSLASGNMGLVAPVAAVLGAAIPAIVTGYAEGFPGYRHLFGFGLAGIGVWLISRSETGAGRPKGLGLAVLAGIGFAAFILCIHRAGNASALWVAACSRSASWLVTANYCPIWKTTPRGACAGAEDCRGCGNPRHYGQRGLHPRRSNRTLGRSGRSQFALSRRHRRAGAHFSARALQPLPHLRHVGGAGGGTHDCGMRIAG